MPQHKLFSSFLLLCLVDFYSPGPSPEGSSSVNPMLTPPSKSESTDPSRGLDHSYSRGQRMVPSISRPPVHLTDTVGAEDKFIEWFLRTSLTSGTERE